MEKLIDLCNINAYNKTLISDFINFNTQFPFCWLHAIFSFAAERGTCKNSKSFYCRVQYKNTITT